MSKQNNSNGIISKKAYYLILFTNGKTTCSSCKVLMRENTRCIFLNKLSRGRDNWQFLCMEHRIALEGIPLLHDYAKIRKDHISIFLPLIKKVDLGLYEGLLIWSDIRPISAKYLIAQLMEYKEIFSQEALLILNEWLYDVDYYLKEGSAPNFVKIEDIVKEDK